MSNPFEGLIKRYTVPPKREKWITQVSTTLVKEVFPDEPWQYKLAPSFIQFDDFSLDSPSTLTLMFPKIPLAVDILWEKYDTDYRNAKPYIGREAWELEQKRLSMKISSFAGVQCPYLVVREYQPDDFFSLKLALKSVIGNYKGWK